VDPDPAVDFDTDPGTGPAFHAYADLDPASRKYADRQHWLIHQHDFDVQLCMCDVQRTRHYWYVSICIFLFLFSNVITP
jgi:hypothetical protein